MTAQITHLRDHQQEIILPMDILRTNLGILGHIAKHMQQSGTNLILATHIDDEDGFTRNGYQAMVYIRNALNVVIDRCDADINRTLRGHYEHR